MKVFQFFAEQGRVKSMRPWFITQQDAKPYLLPRKPRNKMESAQVASQLVRSNSVGSVISSVIGSAPVDMDIDGEEDDAAASTSTLQATTNRWRLREFLQHDYAEYRSCCGKPAKWTEQFLKAGLSGRALVEEHSSHSPQALFKARLKHRAGFTDKKSYDHSIANELLLGAPRWNGYEVCCSCFRAALGIGRSALFNLTKQATNEASLKLTQSGSLKKERKAMSRGRVVDLLRRFSLQCGGRAPNQRNTDPSRRRFVLPQKRIPELQEALIAYDQESRALPLPEKLSRTSIYRAIAHLQVFENHFISLGKGNSLCRCAVCDKLDNQCTPAYVKEHQLKPKDVLAIKAKKLSHLAQMQEQRAQFDAYKEKAMRQCLELWCITHDGMDQSKTQLPSRARYSKDLEPQPRVKVHWVGAFCFGGPDPVLGLMNTPEIRKDAALSIVTLERILDLQWLKLVELHEAAGRVAATRSQAASQAEAEEERKEEVPDIGDSSTLDSSTATYSGPGMKWPRRLHVTFDNAGSESKNQWMMRFLGLLVFHGVFEAITTSQLLVGHTHDIVDQMFSVWSRMLRIYNAETYEKMRALFRDRYHSRIDGLVDLMKGRQEAYDALTKEEQQAYDAEIGEAAAHWSAEEADILADFSAFVKKHDLLRPHIVQQTETIDVEGWLCKAVAAKHPPALKGIAKSYSFGIEKDKAGNVYLYNSQFAKSGDINIGPVVNSFPGQVTGNWTTRAILYHASDPGLSTDPYRVPPLTIDLAPLRATVVKYVEHKAMNAEERNQFNAMLDRLQQGQDKQKADCQSCYNALVSFGRHGVVSQRKGATEEDRAQANKKLSDRNKSWVALQAHLRDPAFAAEHDANMVHTGFWTKWLQRKRDHIEPAYVERGYIFDPAVLAEPYHPAETELCSGVGEPPVHSDRAARIDLIYLHQKGTPAEGQVAIHRTSETREPFYMGKITAVRLSEKATRKRQTTEAVQVNAEQEAAAACSAGPAPARLSQPAAAAAAAAAAQQPVGEPVCSTGPARLKDLEFQVLYYDLCPEDFEELHLSSAADNAVKKAADARWWQDRFAGNELTEEALEAALQNATSNRKAAPARPRWLVELYQTSRFLVDKLSKASSAWISGAALVAWGTEGQLLKPAQKSRSGPTCVLKAAVWRQLQEDLTELKPDRSTEIPSSSSSSNLKARAGVSKRKKHSDSQEDDDSDAEASVGAQGHSGGAAGAAAASASTRSRHPRTAHAVAPIVDQEDDEEEPDQDESSASAGSSDPDDDVEMQDDDHLPLTTFKLNAAHVQHQENAKSSKPRGKTNKQAASPAASRLPQKNKAAAYSSKRKRK